MATYVAWKPYYSVGDSSLDAEHQQILKAIDELYATMSTYEENAKNKKLLDRLVQYTLTHFQHEERIMEEAGYPALAAHKIEHERMRQRTHELRANFSQVKGVELLRFLKEWWTNHIQAEDKAYAPYLGSQPPANAEAAVARPGCD
jgi:hemerythrin-like metal-binding protein